MDYENIEHNAELRVTKENGFFKVEYKNPGSREFEFFIGSFDHLAAEREADNISKVIHDEPKRYKTEGHNPQKRPKPQYIRDWEDD
jgi:hypothetical protein